MPTGGQPRLAACPRPLSQFGGASYNVHCDDEVDAGDMPLLQRETPRPRTTLPGGYKDVLDADDMQETNMATPGTVGYRSASPGGTLSSITLTHCMLSFPC